MQKRNVKVVYLMRGVPGSGKSFAARRLAGKHGLVCETDSFFGPPGKKYKFDISRRPQARFRNKWAFLAGLRNGISPIVVDRGNGTGERTKWYIKMALRFGYQVKLAEPTSKWWKQIRKLMMQEERWVAKLANMQKKTHRVSAGAIRRSMNRFDSELTVRDILEG